MGSTDGSDDGKLQGLLIGDSLGSTDGKVLGTNESIKLVSSDSKVLGTVIGIIDVITLGIDYGKDLGSLDGSLYFSNDGMFEGCLCCRSRGILYHPCSHYMQVCCDGRHRCRLSRLDMAGITFCGRRVDIWQCWVTCNE